MRIARVLFRDRRRAAVARASLLAVLSVPLAVSASEAPRVASPPAAERDAASAESSAIAPPSGVVTLEDARAAALHASPRLSGLSAEVSSRRALALQAGVLPNPEVALEFENVGGTGDREAFEQTETTLWVSQLVPLGGKVDERERAAALAGDLAAWSLEAARREVLADATKAFVATLAAQEHVALARDLVRLAGESTRAVAVQVRSGGASTVEEARARLVAGEADIERSGAERALAASRAALAATWGGDAASFREVRGDLAALAPPPPLGQLGGLLPESPGLARWETELAQREAALALERARRVPDPTIRLGARHFHDNDDDALVFEVAVPLPLFDRNDGNVLAAGHDVARARSEHDQARVAAAAELAQHYQELARSYEEAVALRERLVPDARAAFAGVRDGYRAGRFGQLELLAAQRTLFEVRGRLLDAEVAYHRAAADIERLTGRSLTPSERGRGEVRR